MKLVKIYIGLTFILFNIGQINAQTTGDLIRILDTVEKNSKILEANKKLTLAYKYEAKKENRLANPKIEYVYMGINKTDWYTEMSITKEFESPTTYYRKAQISKTKQTISDFEMEIIRNNIRFEAAEYFLKTIHLTRKYRLLKKQYQIYQSIDSVYKKKLKAGQSTILETNKAAMELLMAKNEVEITLISLNENIQKLKLLNNGIILTFNDSVYPVYEPLPDFETFFNQIKENDPELKIIKKEKLISEYNIKIARNQWIPSFEIGYRQDNNPLTKFNGLIVGLTIPIFGNTYNIKQAQAYALYKNISEEAHLTEHKQELLSLYQKLKTYEENLKLMTEQYEYINTPEILQKSLNSGQISIMEFFTEYNTYNKFSLVLEDLQENTLSTYLELIKIKL